MELVSWYGYCTSIEPPKNIFCSDNKESTKSEDEFDNVKTAGVTTKLMILHCPGCDVLDVFVRDFAFVLESYGLKVKSALLEQTTIDAEGGISSYIQRNIEECHYILLIFSEQVKELNFPKHRPFQFALRILGGLAFSETKKPTYIPLYFTEQKKAMQMIPTFLYPSMGNGFRLPNELKPLISKLKGNQKITSSEKPARLNFFTEKMKNQILKILKNSHQECACDGCNKGEIQYPESELWGTETITSYGKLIENSRLETRSISNNVPSRPNSHESDISINKIINQKTLIENWCNDNFDSDLSNKYVFDTLL